MKYVFLSLFALFSTQITTAQTHKSALKAGLAISHTPYEGVRAFGFDLQYDLHLMGRFSLSAAAGQIWANSNYTESGSGVDANGSWSNSVTFTEKESFGHLDASLLYSFSKPGRKDDLKLGAGISYTHTVLHYPPDIFVNLRQGTIENGDFVDHKADLPMANFLLDYQVSITNHLLVYARGVFRTCFTQQSVLDREIKVDGGRSITSGGIVYNASLTLGVGYSF